MLEQNITSASPARAPVVLDDPVLVLVVADGVEAVVEFFVAGAVLRAFVGSDDVVGGVGAEGVVGVDHVCGGVFSDPFLQRGLAQFVFLVHVDFVGADQLGGVADS